MSVWIDGQRVLLGPHMVFANKTGAYLSRQTPAFVWDDHKSNAQIAAKKTQPTGSSRFTTVVGFIS